jgi:hypothetical protein
MQNWRRWIKIGVVLIVAWFLLKFVFRLAGVALQLLVIAGLIFIVYSVVAYLLDGSRRRY